MGWVCEILGFSMKNIYIPLSKKYFLKHFSFVSKSLAPQTVQNTASSCGKCWTESRELVAFKLFYSFMNNK